MARSNSSFWDYKDNQLGVKDSCQGLNQVEGGWYCLMMPTVLVDASADVRAGRIDAERYATRIAERQTYAARPKPVRAPRATSACCAPPPECTL